MQSNYWPAASASSKPDSSTAADTTNIKQISLVIIRLELDSCVNEEDPILSSPPERDIYTIFNYHSAAYYNKQRTASVKEASLSDYSEKTNQEDLLKTFIGKRQSHLIRIETYDFNEMSANKNSQGQNALTISSALETAYSDWNKSATSSSDPKLDNQESSSVVKTENIQPNQEESMPEQELPKESTQESTETSTSQKEEDKEDRSLTESKLTEETNEEKKTPEKEIPPVKSESTTKSKKSKKHQDGKSNKEEKPPSPIIKQSDSNTTEISFYYGNPTVDIVKGFLHIYKDTTLTPLIDDVNESKRDSKGFSPKQSTLVPSNRSEMLCMIGIPANVGCNELLDFIMPFNETIDYMRIVRDNSPNQYMALIKFKNQKDTDSFYLHNNNRLFNSIEDSVCHLVFVERIEAMNSSKGASLPIPGFTELPTCYICLERMDESLNGVITILCNHSFHANCLSKWGDTCCPVCRYSQTPEYELDNMCSECGSHENLWICLICGHVGCGRYVRGHAYDHFQLTQHTYSMQMGNNRVWDYAADNYVHRLIQNKTDGKLVQLDEGGRVINQDEKIDSITLEYTYLLTTQLESQRLFFEEKMQIVEDKYKSQILDLESKTKQLESENSDLKQNQSQMIKEKSNIEKKCSTLSSKLTKMQSDLEEEKELNKCLSSNQEVYQGKLAKMEENLKKLSQEKDSEIAELKSQLKDIMFYLDAQSKIAESKDVTKEEIDQSQLVIQQNQATGSNAEGQSRRGKKKK